MLLKYGLFTGNYYSLRGQHEKAVQYFQRALRMNPQYLAGWTLMGHEYIEMKNTNAAIQCYRQAIGEDIFSNLSDRLLRFQV